MNNLSLSNDDQEDILDNERLIRVLNELIDKLNDLEARISALEEV